MVVAVKTVGKHWSFWHAIDISAYIPFMWLWDGSKSLSYMISAARKSQKSVNLVRYHSA